MSPLLSNQIFLFVLHAHTRTTQQVKGCIKALKEHSNPQEAKTKSLINALRYTTKHFNDETTPKAIHKMLET